MPPSYAPSSSQGEPPPDLKARVEAALGRPWSNYAKPNTGLSAAHRFVVRLDGGDTVFVKAATTAETAGWLRNEHLALQIAPADLTPRTLAWLDDGDAHPILVTEALIDGHWPAGPGGTIWRAGDLAAVLKSIRRLGELPAETLPRDAGGKSDGWRKLAESPVGFLGLGLCSQAWLAMHADVLAEAEGVVVRSGDAFVHGDMRSDNIWVGGQGVKFVDWSNARHGAPETDLAAFLPAAHLEGGPLPYDAFPEAGGWGAAQGADLARRAVADDTAPKWLRRVFLRLAAINIDWAAQCLRLSPRDGPDWKSI